MSDRLLIEPADPAEDAALRALTLRSKAHWGYDAAFMAQAAPKLGFEPEWYATGRVFVARCAGTTAGVGVVLPPDEAGDSWIEHLFVDPPFMGRGAGRALVAQAQVMARTEGARRLMVLSDPFARPFYERLGARFLHDAPSDAIPDRMLPVLSWSLTP